VEDSFDYGLSKMGLTELQAFSYAYDQAWRLLDSKSAWMRASSYVALMTVAHRHGITLREDDQMLIEIHDELVAALNVEYESIDAPACGDEMGEFERDLRIVREAYIDSW